MDRTNLIRSLIANQEFYAKIFTPPGSTFEEKLCEARKQLAEMRLQALSIESRFRKYSPDQPRVPAGNPDGGQWTSEGGDDSGDDGNDNNALLPGVGTVMDDSGNIYQTPDYTDTTAPDSWANPDLENFENHWENHGADFGAQSPEDYATQANDFYQIAQEVKFPTLQTNQGWLKIYDPQSNSFGVYNPKGETETFFKPTSSDYFINQTQNVLADGGRIIEPLPIEESIIPDIFIP